MQDLYRKLTDAETDADGTIMAAAPPVDRIVETASNWIAVPAQGGIDHPGPIVEAVSASLDALNLPYERLTVDHEDERDRPVGLVVPIMGAKPGPTYVLNAVVDTAPADAASENWQTNPYKPHISSNWLHGRGAADSKTAGALFAHLGAEMMAHRAQMQGNLLLFFDADEHSGKFHGVKAFVEHYPDVDGVMIGYTGHNSIKIGSRGFYRPEIRVTGHRTDMQLEDPIGRSSAIRAAQLLVNLINTPLPEERADGFHLPPTCTPVMMESVRHPTDPGLDQTVLGLDMRTTPAFTAADAERMVRSAIARFDAENPGPEPSTMTVHSTWPHFKISPDHPMVQHLLAGANEHMPAARKRPISLQLTGPSNVGNFLAQHGIAATSGFGLEGKGIHADNERVKITGIAPAYRAYRAGVAGMLGLELGPELNRKKAPDSLAPVATIGAPHP